MDQKKGRHAHRQRAHMPRPRRNIRKPYEVHPEPEMNAPVTIDEVLDGPLHQRWKPDESWVEPFEAGPEEVEVPPEADTPVEAEPVADDEASAEEESNVGDAEDGETADEMLTQAEEELTALGEMQEEVAAEETQEREPLGPGPINSLFEKPMSLGDIDG